MACMQVGRDINICELDTDDVIIMLGGYYWEAEMVTNGDDSEGHVRLGWSTREGELQAPVGYDRHSYGYRDIAGIALFILVSFASCNGACDGQDPSCMTPCALTTSRTASLWGTSSAATSISTPPIATKTKSYSSRMELSKVWHLQARMSPVKSISPRSPSIAALPCALTSDPRSSSSPTHVSSLPSTCSL